MEKLTQVSADIILCPASTISFVADSTKSTVKPDGPEYSLSQDFRLDVS
jgi:hypothetical protein